MENNIDKFLEFIKDEDFQYLIFGKSEEVFFSGIRGSVEDISNIIFSVMKMSTPFAKSILVAIQKYEKELKEKELTIRQN